MSLIRNQLISHRALAGFRQDDATQDNNNKKVLLRERKRHTARRVVSTPSVVLPVPPRGGTEHWPASDRTMQHKTTTTTILIDQFEIQILSRICVHSIIERRNDAVFFFPKNYWVTWRYGFHQCGRRLFFQLFSGYILLLYFLTWNAISC